MPERDTHGIRLSDAERDEAARLLGEHYASGRLTAEEHEERTAAAYAARTRAELPTLFADLPGGPPGSAPTVPPTGSLAGSPTSGWSAAPFPRRGRRRPGGPPGALLLLLGVILVAFVVTRLPFLLLGLVVWWLLAATAVSRHSGRPHAWACPTPPVARHR